MQLNISEQSVLHLDLREQDREAEMVNFKKRYAKEISVLQTVYEAVEVKWGLHQYFG